MRGFALLSILLLASAGLRASGESRPATPDELALFREAMQNSSQDTEHWAYTESTTVKASKGSSRGETVIRFDPSKPYAEQFTPLKVDGKPPTERQLKAYRTRGEKRGERVARAAEAAKQPGSPPPQLRISGQNLTLDFDHPRVEHAEEARIAYEVPIQGTRKDIPLEKFQVLVIVGRQNRQVENATLTLLESFRMKLVAKIKAGEARMDFTVVDPKFGPVITAMTGNFDVSLFFVPVNATFVRTRTDWQRVKSYDERLSVKLGPLQFQDF